MYLLNQLEQHVKLPQKLVKSEMRKNTFFKFRSTGTFWVAVEFFILQIYFMSEPKFAVNKTSAIK